MVTYDLIMFIRSRTCVVLVFNSKDTAKMHRYVNICDRIQKIKQAVLLSAKFASVFTSSWDQRSFSYSMVGTLQRMWHSCPENETQFTRTNWQQMLISTDSLEARLAAHFRQFLLSLIILCLIEEKLKMRVRTDSRFCELDASLKF